MAESRRFFARAGILASAMMMSRHCCPYLTESSRLLMQRFAFATAFVMALLTGNVRALGQIDAAAVQRSIDRGVAYLRKTQNERGGWTEYAGESCGLSALCTLALMNSGVPRDDPDIIDAMRYLRAFQPTETYSVSLQTLVFCQLGAAGDFPRIRRNVEYLVETQVKGAFGGPNGGPQDRGGAWSYGRRQGFGDPSNTQFALLALGAAVDVGVEIDPEVFARSLRYWRTRQTSEGGWFYSVANKASTGSMTCAGIASLIIARGRLGGGSSQIDGESIQCCGGNEAADDPVEHALDWLARNFNLRANPNGGAATYYYYLYALERVGRLTGRRFIGNHDWYREGAQQLLIQQDEFQGFWDGANWESRDVATSFALLFLSKGKRQVVIARLKYPSSLAANSKSSQHWQRHPDSLRQLVRHIERDWRRDLTWQTVISEGARLDDLLQSPVIVISGQQALEFSPELNALLRDYIEQGGSILFDADAGDGCGDSSAFETSVRRLCEEWFDGATLERLPPNHPIWFAEHRVDPTVLGDDFWVYGVQACCRTAVFYVPQTLSCKWELSDMLLRRKDGSQSVRSKISAAVKIGENLVAYATGRELKDKLEQRLVIPGGQLSEPSRDTNRIATLAIDAGGQEAGRAVINAASIINKRLQVNVLSESIPIGFDAEQLKDVAFLWIHGRTDFSLTDAQRSTLREFVERQGIIIGSSICGATEFTEAFRREMRRMFPDSPLDRVPSEHPLLSVDGGFDIRRLTVRTPATEGRPATSRTDLPQLEVAMIEDYAGVFFSPLDISCALESPNSIQCPGYSTEDAAKIVANLILYGLHQ